MFKKLFTAISLSTATVACAAVAFSAGAGVAMAPEAGRLNEALYSQANDWAYGIWVNSGTPTYGFYLPNTWQWGYQYQSYAGYPCSRYRQPAGTTLKGYIMVSGGYSRCSEF